MIPNIDPKNGIRYGVIPVSELNPDIVYNELQPEYPCEDCKYYDNENECNEPCEPTGQFYDDGDIKYFLDETNDIFIVKSPYKTKCRLCSPCAPNAGYIKDQDEDGYETYILPPEYFINPDKYTFEEIKDD